MSHPSRRTTGITRGSIHRGRWTIAAAVAAVAALVAAGLGDEGAPTSVASAGLAIPGVELLYEDATLDAKLDQVKALDVGWLRFDAAWSEIEYTRGRFDWSRVDRAVDGAHARDLSVILILGSAAEWARPAGTEWNHGPADVAARSAFAVFAAAAARRYAYRVAAYEIWNEPNLPGSWSPAPSPSAYAALLRSAYSAVHDADPDAIVLTGGTGGGPTGVDSLQWYKDLYAADLTTMSDGVAVHPYPDAQAKADSGEMAKAGEIRKLMDANGDGAKRLWGTETGVATGGGSASSEPQQASLIGSLYRVWRSIPRTGPLFYYTLTDFDDAGREGSFGLVRRNGSLKPAYDALRDNAAVRSG